MGSLASIGSLGAWLGGCTVGPAYHLPMVLMIIGGDKAQQIQTHPILSEYAQVFEALLTRPDSRLMVIGYGFRDHHINRVIARAVYEHGLQFFVICPEGPKVATTLRSEVHPGAVLAAFGYDLEHVFERGCVGFSTRNLRETFGRPHRCLQDRLQQSLSFAVGCSIQTSWVTSL